MTAALAGAALLVAPLAGAGPDAVTSGARTSDQDASGAASSGSDIVVPGPSVPLDADELAIAPGMQLDTFASLEADGWTSGSVLTVDVDADLTFDHQYSGTVTELETVREGAERTGAAAAINADFFDINNSNAPISAAVTREDGLISSPLPGRHDTVAVTESGAVELAQIFLEGHVSAGDEQWELAGVNTHSIPADGIGVFTPLWGEYTRAASVSGAETTAEVLVEGETVESVGTEIGSGEVAEGAVVLVGRDAGAEALLELEPGDEVSVGYGIRSDVDDVIAAVGGNQVLARDGEPLSFTDEAVHPRTAVGVSEDGSEVFLAVIDGRQAHARGMSLAELADFMIEMGAHEALNVDGGGSSTMVVRDPGTPDHEVINSPSDGGERRVANGLAVFAGGGSGELAGFRMVTPSGSDRVFPGLSRTVAALGHDEARDAVQAAPAWAVDGGSAEIAGDGDAATVTGVEPGAATVTAEQDGVEGELELTVLDALAWIAPESQLVSLADGEATGRIDVTGYDAAGYQAPIETGDLTVTGGDGVVEIAADDTGLTVTPLVDEGSALLTLEAGGISAEVAVTIGLVEEVVADFADAADWRVAFARATGDIEPTEGPDGTDAVRLTYDFTGGNTRAAYARPPGEVILPGQPQSLKAWVNGDGEGTWIRMRLWDAQGTQITLDGGHTTFTGWEQLSFPIPPGTQYPLSLRDIYAVEPRADALYTGETSFGEITADVPPEVELPSLQTFPDPVVTVDGTNDDAAQRIAVMNDAQFVARDPESDAVEAARRTLQEIVAAEPDLLIINGDFVDEAAPEDFALAREILDEELADAEFPYYYVPGNHEIMGGPIDNFIEEFGETQHVVDLDSTRIITLNTAYGTLRADGREFDQIMVLREQLDAAAEDPSVSGVLVAGHHPANDPLPTANSQLSDRLEAELLERWLAEFRAETGKGAAYLSGHVGMYHASSIDGVAHLIVGNSGKGPSSTPDNGGFTGWAMLGIEPDAEPGDGWLSAEMLPRVDAVEIDAPARVAQGATESISATIEQDDTRTVPVGWPMSAEWGGDRVHVGDADDADSGAVVAIDPEDGTVTGLRVGAAVAALTVNGETETVRIQVGPR